MRYFRSILSAVFLCLATTLLAQTNVLRIAPVTYPAGKTVTLSIEMDNASDIVGVQFDIDVPYELSTEDDAIVVNQSKSRCGNHNVTTRNMGRGGWYNFGNSDTRTQYYRYRFIIFSDDNSRIIGTSGTLLSLELPLPGDLDNGVVIPVVLVDNTVVLTNREQQNVVTSKENGTVTIEAVPRPDLTPTDVSVGQTTVDPNGKLDFSWTVKNIGELATGAGWTERLYLESQTTQQQVYVGTTAYEGTLAVNGSVERSASFSLSDYPGIGGKCRPVVQIIPAADCGEIASLQNNNTAAATGYSLTVSKYLMLTANKNVIPKNSTNGFYCELRRTGNTSMAETFNITSSDKAGQTDRLSFSNNGRVTFAKGSNRASFYAYAVQNDRFDTDPKVAVIVNETLNNGYDIAVDSVTMEETNLVPLVLKTDKSDYNEGETIHLTVSVAQRPWEGQLAVYLNIEEQKRFKLLQRVVFDDGALEATIDIPVIQDKNPANDVSVKISGTAEHYAQGETLFMLHDDDTPAIQMTLAPTTVSEGAGPQAILGTITRTGVTNNKITVKLTDDGVNDIYYSQQTFTMPAGTTTIKFPLGVKDNQDVDGDRTVRIRAAVYMTDCNCSAIGDKQAVVTDSIRITDDDGPTLSIVANKSTILEGDEEGCALTISRNSTGAAVTVTLKSDAADVTYTKTVTIPEGQKSATAQFAANSNDTPEGDRTVSVIAEASGYSAGSTWLLISDRTMPDLIISKFELDKDNIHENVPVTANVEVTNIGSAAVPASVPIKLYYDDREWTTYTTDQPIGKGETKTFVITRNLTSNGTFDIKAVVNPDNKPVELLTTNNTSETLKLTCVSLYNYTMEPRQPGYNPGAKAEFNGTCIGIDGVVKDGHHFIGFLECNGQREKVYPSSFNEETGRYYAAGGIPASFSGTVRYGMCSSNDFETSKNYLGTIEVYGMERTENSYAVHDLYVGEPTEFTLRIRNNCGLPLHNITGVAKGATALSTANYDINVTPIATLEPYAEADLHYTLTGKSLTKANNYEQFQIILTSEEGTQMSFNTWNYTKNRIADLVVSENNIKTTVQITQPRHYPIWITNKGEAATGKIFVSLPTGMGKFVTLASAATLPSLERGDSTMILLKFDSQGFDINVEQTGAIAINCENGNGTLIHFSVTTVSESKGNLKVYVQDEMTIYGDKDGNHPYVSEATVQLKDYNTGANIQTLTTGASGIVTFEGINEGFYQLYVTAPKHDSYRQNVIIAPGETKNHTATISYQAVAVNWDVVETEVEDEYEIVTTLTYETQVPVPVIVMTAPDTLRLENLQEGQSMMFNVVLRNEGLIAAQNTNLTLPETEGFTFTPLVPYEGVIIGAQQSYVIPVRATRNVKEERPAEARGIFKAASSGSGCGKYLADFEWPCGNDHKHAWIAKGVNLIKDVGTGGGSGCGNGSWGGAGGGDGPAFSGNGGGLYWKTASDGALRGTIDLLCAMSNLIPNPDGIDDFMDGARNDLDFMQGRQGFGGWAKNEVTNRWNSTINDAKDHFTGGWYSKGNDWYNFYNGVKNVYDNVGKGNYLARGLNAPEDESSSTEEEETDPATVEGTAEYYQKIFESYVDNSYFISYLTKMNLYGARIFVKEDLMTEVFDAPEAFQNATGDFLESMVKLLEICDTLSTHMDIYNQVIYVLDYHPTIGMDAWLQGMKYVSKINAVKLNGADTFYDFSYESYVRRYYKFLKRWIDWEDYKAKRENDQTGQYTHIALINEFDYRDRYTSGKTNSRWLERSETIRSRYVKEYTNRIDSLENDLVLKGFESWDDLYASAQQDLLDMYENMGKNTCANVKLEIDQKLVMTRQAFRGTLTVENGLSTDLTGIELSLLVKDLMGSEATSHEFQINFEKIEGFEGSVEGPWTLGPKAKGVATVLFIPTKYAAPEGLTTWSFGGTLYFTDGDGNTQVRQLLPVSLQVKPSPDLDLTYFVQRDIYGDNPLTKDVIEPIVPAEFSVLIHNKGKGNASNIRMFTRQPQIVDNEKGLLIDFNIISSRLNDGETVLALDSTIATVFGDIPAGKSSYARWDLTASLLGHFNKYDVSVNHVTSYGNPDLSLVDNVSIHELIHSCALPKYTLSQTGSYQQLEPMHIWAVNDNLGFHPDDVPDRMYLSDGTYLPIIDCTDITTMKYNGTDTYTYSLHIDLTKIDKEGLGNLYFIYTSFADPTMGGGGIQQASYIDDTGNNATMPDKDMIWQTQYTMHDGGEPLRDNKVHLLMPAYSWEDHWGNTNYTRNIKASVTFEPTPLNRLDVKSIETVPQGNGIATDVLDELTVTFNKPIQEESFDRNDMVLRYEGELLSDDILITKAADNDSIFTVKMQNVDRNGYYTLQVNSNNVTDHEGFAGKDGKQVGWMLFKGGLVQYNVEPWPNDIVGGVATSNEQTSGDIVYGSNVTMTATPAEGYTFDYWGTVDESVESVASARARVKAHAPEASIAESQIERYSDENPVVVPMKKAYNLRAVFKPQNCSVTIVCDEQQGTVNTPTAVYDYGTVLSLHAEAKEGYVFVGYSDGETMLSADADYDYTVTGAATITALFKSTAPESILLRETVDYTPVAVESANVRLQRTFNKSQWSTLCVPFDISDPASVFGAETKVARLDGIEGSMLLFNTVSSIEANVPCLIYAGFVNSNSSLEDDAALQSIYTIRDTELKVPETGLTFSKNGVEMTGTYVDINLPTADSYYTLQKDIVELVGEDAVVPTGRYRAYFHIPGCSYETLTIIFDGIMTDISVRQVNSQPIGDLYTLSGVLIQRKANIGQLRKEGKLQPGIYIMDGNKVVIK